MALIEHRNEVICDVCGCQNKEGIRIRQKIMILPNLILEIQVCETCLSLAFQKFHKE